MGLLANVDSSISQLKLEHALRIESLDEKEGFELIRELEGLSASSFLNTITHSPCINSTEHKIYFVTADIWADDILGPEVSKFDNEILNDYLNSTLRLARLFKQGNITNPISYYYYADRGARKAKMIRSTLAHVARESFTLTNDAGDLQKFISEAKLPFKEAYLQLALQNFESSYDQHGTQLPFLLCMIALEVMFNPGGAELSHRVRRNAAVLLGKDEADSRQIYSHIGKLYDSRSELVHAGTAKITEKDLQSLRNYVREAIKMIYKGSKTKEELLNLLNSRGFGDRPIKT